MNIIEFLQFRSHLDSDFRSSFTYTLLAIGSLQWCNNQGSLMANLCLIQKTLIMLSNGVSFKFEVVKFEKKGNFVGKSKFKVLVQHEHVTC